MIGTGGIGTANSYSGSSVTYAKGGNGATSNNSVAPTNGTDNRGNGGDGSINAGSGGNGGSGIVILRYADTFADLRTIAGTLVYTKTTTGGFKIYTFTAGTGTVTV